MKGRQHLKFMCFYKHKVSALLRFASFQGTESIKLLGKEWQMKRNISSNISEFIFILLVKLIEGCE